MIQSQMEHPNIVHLLDFAETDNNYEMILDYCSDGSYFEDRLEEVG